MPRDFDETPTEGMKRIEQAFSPTAGAGRSMYGYNAGIGARGGPLSGNLIGAGDPTTGQPVMVGGRAQAGPLSYQYMQPTFRGAQPTQQVGVTVPFDADAYFGLTAQQGPGGRAYGANVGRGGFNAYGQYNPERRDLSIGAGYQTNFAGGGPVHMYEGGDPPTRPLTIYRGERPTVDAEPETSLYPSQDERPIPMPVPRPAFIDAAPPVASDQYSDVSAPEAYNRRFADTVRGIPQSVVDYFAAKTAQPDPSQRIAEDLMFAGSALGSIPGKVVDYFGRKSEQPDPSQRIAEDITHFGGVMKEEFMKNPGGFMMDMANIPGMVTAGADAARIKREYDEAVATGNEAKASSLKSQFGATMLAGLPLVGPMAKMAEKGVIKTIADVALQEADATARMAEKFAGKAGTAPEEMAKMFDDVRGTQVGKMVERYQELPPEEAMQLLYQDLKGLAVEGEVGKEWYERSSKRILEFLGGDPEAADKFAQLIAIYSPQTAVDVNTQNAMKAYNRALAGEKLWDGEIINPDMSFPTIKASDDYVRSLGGSKEGYTKIPLDDSGKRFLIAKHGDTKAYENIATLDRDLKAHLVMNEGIPFNGRKINNFYNNLMVQIDPSRLQGSTQDLWMARAFGYLDDAVGGTKKYELMERMTADLAAELGWQPHQVQAAIWTAMKTRQEGVKDAVKASALDMGIAERVPDPANPGKMMFKVKDGREAEYGALMREQSLGADVTPEAIAAAARDFSDFLDQNLAHVSWESAPSTKVGHLDGFEALPPEAKAEYHVGIQQALQGEDGQDLLARYLNILSPGAIDAPGYWEGASNPATLRQVGATRIKAAKQAPDIDSASKEMMEIYAAGLGLLLKQDGVGYHRPYFNPQITKANGMEFRFENPLSREDIVALGNALDAKFGGSVAMIPAGDSEIRFLNFGDTKNQKDFHKAVADVVGGVKMENSAKARAFASDGDLVSNNWLERPNGEDYVRRLSASGRSDVLEYISNFLAPRVEAFDRKFAAQYGLKRNEALEEQIRNAKNITVDYAQGGSVRGYAEGGEVAPAPAFNLDQKVDATVQDIINLAEDGDIDQRKLAFLLRKASTGTMPADVSYEFAGEIMSHDTPALIERFGRYPRSIRVLARVDLALGGLGGQALGMLANQKIRTEPASPTGAKERGYAKGGKVARKPYTGDKKAFEQFSDFALQNYGPQIGQNMINRSGGDAAKLMFALGQYTKNLVAQDPDRADLHRSQLQQLGQIASANKIDPRATFNRTPDTMETRKELQEILKGDHKLNPAFKTALERMDRLVGSQ